MQNTELELHLYFPVVVSLMSFDKLEWRDYLCCQSDCASDDSSKACDSLECSSASETLEQQ